MPVFQIRFMPMILLVGLLSSCLPKGCLNEIETIGEAQPTITNVSLRDKSDPIAFQKIKPPRPPAKPGKTWVCTEFATIRAEDSEKLIFVDAARPDNSGTGDSWETAKKTINEAINIAYGMRDLEIKANAATKQIRIIIAGGEYSAKHEVSHDAKNTSIINLAGHIGYMKSIDILGGYRSGDACLEITKNYNPEDKVEEEAARLTILDGKREAGQLSNHVIYITNNATDISIKNFIVRNGHAKEEKADEPYKRFGGGILVLKATNLELEEIRVESCTAEKFGGCIAIGYGDESRTIIKPDDDKSTQPTGIKLTKVTLEGCEAQDGGAGLYIGGKAHTITVDGLSVTRSTAVTPESRGGGILITDNAGVGGQPDNIKFTDVKIDSNSAGMMAGGIFIGASFGKMDEDKVGNVQFFSFAITGNTAREDGSNGGGVALTGMVMGNVNFVSGKISGNYAKVGGAGLFMGYTNARGTGPNILEVKGVEITQNILNGNSGDEKGAGIMIQGPSGNVLAEVVTLSKNEANGNGVGLAILGDVRDVKFKRSKVFANKISDNTYRDGNGIWVSAVGAERPQNISFSEMEIKNHLKGKNGSGLFVSGAHLTLQQSTFESNHSSDNGGGAFIENSIIREHEGNTYIDNTAKLRGGAVFVNGSRGNNFTGFLNFRMVGITCEKNMAAEEGGCAYIRRAPNTKIDGGNFEGNGHKATFPHPTKKGGAIYYEADSLDAGIDAAAKLEISGGTYEKNQAYEGGGAIYTQNVFNLHIMGAGVSFAENSVTKNDASGGALHVDFKNFATAINNTFKKGGEITIDGNASFTKNKAPGDGGAGYFGNNVRSFETGAGAIKFVENRSEGGSGGAIYAGFKRDDLNPNTDGTKLSLSDSSEFTKNFAKSDFSVGGAVIIDGGPATVEIASNFSDNEAYSGGAGLYIFSSNPIVDLKMANSLKFEKNQIANGSGGGLLVDAKIASFSQGLRGKYKGNQAPSLGGAVAFLEDLPNAILQINEATFDGNITQDHDPAFHFAKIPVEGMKFYNTKILNHTRVSDGCGGVLDMSNYEIKRLEFVGVETDEKVADVHDKLQIVKNSTTKGPGGAFCVKKILNNLSMNRIANIEENIANTGSAGFLYVEEDSPALDIKIENAFIKKNHSRVSGNGGALSFKNVGKVEIKDSVIRENTSTGSGGGLSFDTITSFKADGSSFVENTATANGGGIAIEKVTDVNIFYKPDSALKYIHSLASRAWGLAFDPSDEAISATRGNTSGGNGGGYYFGEITGDLNVSNHLLAGNSAVNGGAIYVGKVKPKGGGNKTVVQILSTITAKNIASGNGGAICLPNLGGVDTDLIIGNFEALNQYVAYHRNRQNLANIFDFNRVFQTGISDLADKTDLGGQRDVAFTFSANTAGDRGGVVFANNVNIVTINQIPSADNKARQGGTFFISDLHDTARLSNSIVFGGKANNNAGAMYLAGSDGAQAKLEINSSSIQMSRVDSPTAVAAGALYADKIKSAIIMDSTFLDNQINARGHHSAGVMMVRSWTGGINDHFELKLNVANFRKSRFENNIVLNQTPDSKATVLIPLAWWNQEFQPQDPLSAALNNRVVSAGNSPAGSDGTVNKDVIGPHNIPAI